MGGGERSEAPGYEVSQGDGRPSVGNAVSGDAGAPYADGRCGCSRCGHGMPSESCSHDIVRLKLMECCVSTIQQLKKKKKKKAGR